MIRKAVWFGAAAWSESWRESESWVEGERWPQYRFRTDLLDVSKSWSRDRAWYWGRSLNWRIRR
jgi:hypothetical protein